MITNGKVSEINFCKKHLSEYKSGNYTFKVTDESVKDDLLIEEKPKDLNKGLKSKFAEAFDIEEESSVDDYECNCEKCSNEEDCFMSCGFEEDEEVMEFTKETSSSEDVIQANNNDYEQEHDVVKLNKMLNEAVRIEDYILAAKIRDRIKLING
jgi:protein-arginine kinase activator protein McsA